MTLDEFRSCYSEARRIFPTVMSTLQGETFVVWHERKFSAVEKCDADLGLLSCMDEEVIPNGERFLAMWHRHSENHATKRHDRERRRHKVEAVDREGQRWVLSLKRTLAEALKLPTSERRQFIESQFDTEADDDRASAYHRCPVCRDSGWVYVWDRATMAALLRGAEPEDVGWGQALAACECKRGEDVWNKHDQQLARLGFKQYHVWCDGDDSKAKAIAMAEAYRNKTPYREFADWNSEVA